MSSVGFPYFVRFVPDGQAGKLRRRLLLRARDRIRGGPAGRRRGHRRDRVLPGPPRDGRPRARRARAARARRARARSAPPSAAHHPPIRRLTAVIPVFRSARVDAVAAETLRHVDDVVLVDDGAPPAIAALLDAAADDPRVHVLRLGANQGKGVGRGRRHRRGARARPRRRDRPGLRRAASRAADPRVRRRRRRRRGRRDRRPPARDAAMPVARRVANARLDLGARPRRAAEAARHPERDAALPCRRAARRAAAHRTLRGRDAAPQGAAPRRSQRRLGVDAGDLRGRAELVPARRRHAARRARRPRARTAARDGDVGPGDRRAAGHRRGMGAADRPRACCWPGPSRRRCRCWLGSTSGSSWPSTVWATVPSGSTRRSTRTAATTCSSRPPPRWACSPAPAGSATPAARCSPWRSPACSPTSSSRSSSSRVDRPRPEEALGAEVLRSHGRHWSHIPSFPSGHLIVTTALVVAAAAMAPLPADPGLRLSRRGRRHADHVRRALPARRRRRHDRRLAGRRSSRSP